MPTDAPAPTDTPLPAPTPMPTATDTPRPTDRPGSVLYVRSAATGNNDGSSWTDAYTDLQDALGVAQAGDEIWVAAGVYYPDEGVEQTDDDRESTFRLQKGVALYGDFAGTEDERDERDWRTNVTVLSGDIDGNDGTDANGVVTDTANIVGANAYHVVTGDGVTETAVLDSFTITAGFADASNRPQNRGGGMVNSDSSPTLANVTFGANVARYGGGMFNDNSSPTLTNVTLSANEARSGGGMYNSDNTGPMLINVTVSGNLATFGGGMYNDNTSPTLINVTVSGNLAHWDGGGMYNHASSPTLVNCILWGNSPDSIANEDDSIPMITYSDMEGNDSGGANIEADPLFIDLVSAYRAPTTAGDYRLTEGSPAIDAGTNDVVTVETDIDDSPRIADGKGDGRAIVDMGAYEY